MQQTESALPEFGPDVRFLAVTLGQAAPGKWLPATACPVSFCFQLPAADAAQCNGSSACPRLMRLPSFVAPCLLFHAADIARIKIRDANATARRWEVPGQLFAAGSLLAGALGG